MSTFPDGKGPICSICKRRRLKDRSSKQCGLCRVDQEWFKDVEGVALSEERTPEQDVKLRRAQEAATRYRKLYESSIREDAEEERLISLFHTSIDSLPKIPRVLHGAPSIRASRGKTQETPLLALGDLHIGQIINKAATHGINEYNFDIFQDRLEHLENCLLDILFSHQHSEYPELVIAGIGDNVSGTIHEELQKHGAQHIIDQVYIGATAVSVFINRISAHFKHIRFVGMSGNHGRVKVGKPESMNYWKNYDRLFCSIMAQRLYANKRVEMILPEAVFTVIDVAKHKILISHGQELPPSPMGIPAYSMNRAAGGYQEVLRMAGLHFDYWLLGHIHRPMELDTTIVNGCFPGYDEYAVGRLFKPIRPMQKLIGFHEQHGKAWEYPIRLDGAPKAKRYRFEHDMGTSEVLDMAAEIQSK